MAQDGTGDSGSGSNGGKKYLHDEPEIKKNIKDLKETTKEHKNKLTELDAKVTLLKDDVKTLDVKMDGVTSGIGEIKEVVVRMDEKQGTYLKREDYMADKVEEAKAENTGIHAMPASPKESWWKQAGYVIPAIVGFLAILGTLGVSFGFKGDEPKAAAIKEPVMVKEASSEVKEFIEEQRKFMKRFERMLIEKDGTPILLRRAEKDKDETPGG